MSFRKLVIGLLCLLPCLNGNATALKSRALSIADIPPCGIQCLFLTIPGTGCSLDDYDCQCHNEDLAYTLSACMLANCTMADSLGTAKVQADICNLSEESTTRDVRIYTIAVFTIGVVSVALRITAKVLGKRFSPDDWILVPAILLTSIPVGCVLAMTGLGFGEHLWNLQPGNLSRVLKLFYISQSTYVVVLALIKVSLIMFYLQIFSQSRNFRIASYSVLAYIIVNTLIIFFLTLFSCKPVEYFWNRDINGKCMDINALAYANSASAIVQDVILLILPLAMVRKLNMKRHRKVAVGLMFFIGTFGCITTILRLRALLKFRISIDPTWDYVPATIWTELELGSGFVCICLPSIRILLAMILPKRWFDSLTSRSTRNANTGPSARGRHEGTDDRKNTSSWLRIKNIESDSNTSESRPRGSLPDSTDGAKEHKRRLTIGSMFGNEPPPIQLDSIKNRSVKQPKNTLVLPYDRRGTASRASCQSFESNDQTITALPSVGLLPDRSYSIVDLTKPGKRRGDNNI